MSMIKHDIAPAIAMAAWHASEMRKRVVCQDAEGESPADEAAVALKRQTDRDQGRPTQRARMGSTSLGLRLKQ